LDYQTRQDRVDDIKKQLQNAIHQVNTIHSQEPILIEMKQKYNDEIIKNEKLQQQVHMQQLLLQYQSHIVPEHERLKTRNIKLELENQELKKELQKALSKLQDTRLLFQMEFHRGMERVRNLKSKNNITRMS
jgi:hypothetical protein